MERTNQAPSQNPPLQMQDHHAYDGGADQHLQTLKDSFKQAANSLTQLYKQSNHSYNVAYQQGKTDAYEETLAWLMAQTSGAGDKHQNVSLQKFRQFLNEKAPQLKEDQTAAALFKQQQQTAGQQSQMIKPAGGAQASSFQTPVVLVGKKRQRSESPDEEDEWSCDNQNSDVPMEEGHDKPK